MRIITGKYKGKTIKIPQGIRPTQDKVRKALFDILGNIEGLSFLDLYAGSGAVGLEALSQEASRVVFVENDSRCINIIKKNLGILDAACLPPACRTGRDRQGCLMQIDVSLAIKQLAENTERFDIIFLDPPYYQDLAKKTLKILSYYDIVSPNSLIICQHFKKDNLSDNLGDLVLFKQARYGDTILSFYRKRPVSV